MSNTAVTVKKSWSTEKSFYSWSESIDSFLAEVARISHKPAAPKLPSVSPGAVVAHRYRLKRVLGRGGHGVVWFAEDDLSQRNVAIKLIAADPDHSARVRTEIVSLRKLNAVGVVSLLDEGIEPGFVFIVMPLVSGAPFPAKRTPTPWTDLRVPAERLLETLARVHVMGIVHRDLKPANVLVTADGTPTVLDFGVSIPRFFGKADDSRQLVGTPAYLAPEQIGGGTVDHRADLYGVGTMLYESLTGALPHQGSDVRALVAAKFFPPRSLHKAVPELPSHVAETIDALLAPDPADRPFSAAETLDRLRGARPSHASDAPLWAIVAAPDAPSRIEKETLRELFVATESFSSLAEDAAHLLHEAIGGDAKVLEARVEAWISAGICRWESGPRSRLVVDRASIDRLEVGARLASPKTDDPAASAIVIRHARELAREGRLGLATALLGETLTTLLAARPIDVEHVDGLLALWVQIALTDGAPEMLDRVLYEICRVGALSAGVAHLEGLVRAALAVGPWNERALDLASSLAPFAEIELEVWRQWVRVVAARRASVAREEQLVEELAAWSETICHAWVKGTVAGWRGRLRYRQGRFLEAAELHETAAAAQVWKTLRAASLARAASAHMEAFSLERAENLAIEARDFYHSARHASGCANAEWLVRTIAYRRGDPIAIDEGWIERVAGLGLRELHGLVCVTEAAVAWRSGDAARACALAARGRDAWSSLGENAGALYLASALVIACSPMGSAPDSVVEELAARSADCGTPGIGLQVLALLDAHRPATSSDHAAELAAQVPRAHWAHRIDVLSVDEALAILASRSENEASAAGKSHIATPGEPTTQTQSTGESADT